MRALSIKSRLVLLILVAALPVILFHVWTAIDRRTEVRAGAEEQLLRSARLLAAQQVAQFSNARNILETLTMMAGQFGIDDSGCDPFLDRVAAANPTYVRLVLATADGRVLCTSSNDGSPETLVGDAGFETARSLGGFGVGTPEGGLLPVALMSNGGSGGDPFAAMALIDLDEIEGAMALSRLPAGGIGVMFDSGRNILAAVPGGVEIDQTVFEAVTPAMAESAGGPGTISTVSGTGEQYLWAVSDFMPEAGLFVAVGVELDALLSPADRNLWSGILILLAVFAVAATAAWFVGERAIRQPLERLGNSVSRVRRGDLSVRSGKSSTARELSELESGFDEMATALQAREGDLQARNRRLNELVAEKENLVREMNHRVKNSLQLVSSVVSLQLGGIDDEEVRARLNDARARVDAIAKVHERLYAGARLDRIEVGPYLHDLCADLGRSIGLRDTDTALTVTADDCELPPDYVIPIGMIVCELVTNAAKHGVPGRRGTIEVALAVEGNDVALTIADDGQGVPEGVDPMASSGLGMKVVSALARQLNGSFNIERVETGTRMAIQFHLPQDC